MGKERFSFFVTQDNKAHLQRAKESSGRTMSVILNNLIEQSFSDPIKLLKDEMKKHLDMVDILKHQIQRLEEANLGTIKIGGKNGN